MKELARAAEVPCVLTLGILPVPALDLSLQSCLQRDSFVLKTNHGWNDLVFVERIAQDRYRLSGKHIKGDFSLREANNAIRRHFRWWINRYRLSSEWAVTQIAPRLLFAEPLLELNDDFKLFVVGGKVLWIDALAGRWENDRSWGGLFDSDWNLISYTGSTAKRFPDNPTQAVLDHFPRPKMLRDLVNYAERVVPNDMSLMRVDFFQQPDGSFVLGESAAYSNAGRPHHNEDLELLLGQMVFDEMEKRGFLAEK